jgi:hypothetical protein
MIKFSPGVTKGYSHSTSTGLIFVKALIAAFKAQAMVNQGNPVGVECE